MIFDKNSMCYLQMAQDIEGEQSVQLSFAPLVIIMVGTGKTAIIAEGEPILATAGNIIIAKGLVQIIPAEPCHLLVVGIGGSAANSVQVSKTLLTDATICPLVPQLMYEICNTQDVSQTSVQCFSLLCEIANADNTVSTLPRLVADAILAMRENFAGLYGVEELSAQLEVSKSHLVRVFSAAMGMPPGQYLTRVRIQAAKQLLVNRDYSLDVVATLSGFAGANYFCKVFKKETGQTPGDYRQATQRKEAKTAENIHDLEAMMYM